jgi:hypothetical protein
MACAGAAMTISKYALKRRVQVLREQYATVGDIRFDHIEQNFEGYLRGLPPQRQPKSQHERRAMELHWLEAEIKRVQQLEGRIRA